MLAVDGWSVRTALTGSAAESESVVVAIVGIRIADLKTTVSQKLLSGF
jgi:hypothetical protein